MYNIITPKGILEHLKTKDLKLSFYESVDSTNSLLKEMALNGETEGSIVIALSQSKGRGRYDRKFQSDMGGIYMSILLRPKNIINTALLTAATAVAVSDAIENVANVATQIKWVNDILINGKKVCGILCEGGFTGDSGFIIVGIGINAVMPKNGFDNEIKDTADAIFKETSPTVCEELTAKIIDNVFYQYNNLERLDFLKKYRDKNLVLNKEVNILKQGEIIDSGKVLEIDDNCHLTVKLSSGETATLSSGEVSVRL